MTKIFQLPNLVTKSFQSPRLITIFFWASTKKMIQSLDQWSLLIKQLRISRELPMFPGILKFWIVDYGDQKLVTKKFWLLIMVTKSW
jgi:hypothetical protein